MRQTLRNAVVHEFISIKTRQPVVSAEPEKAPWIWHDLVHAITRQAVSSSVGADGKLLGAMWRAGNENEYGDGNRSLHGAAIIQASESAKQPNQMPGLRVSKGLSVPGHGLS